MKRIYPVALAVFVCLWLSAAGLCAQPLSGELGELCSLFARSMALEQELRPGVAKISPESSRIRQDFTDSVSRIEFLKSIVLRDIAAGLEKGDTEALDAFVSTVSALPSNDPVRRQFIPLTRALRSKLVFLRLTSEQARHQDIESRLAALEGINEALSTAAAPGNTKSPRTAPPIYISFHWHMHQPIYWPYEDILTTDHRGVYSYSVVDVFNQRMGPYTSWPWDAVKSIADAGLPDGGAQVSFSGSLMENLNVIKGNSGWAGSYAAGRHLKTVRGNPRLDMVAFGYHHPLMALIGYEDIRRQIAAHRDMLLRTFGDDVPYSKGIFPPENAFAKWMIPALVDEGLEWVMVDNIHFNRACKGYPWVKGENLFPPNPADQRNVNPGSWLQLNGLWAPSKVSAWADRPHWVEMTDPATGKTATTPGGKPARMIAVPTERYLGNEDGRGGFGALNYEAVMSQLLSENNDPDHPILLVLHHDGDNYGGGSDGYYHANFSRFVEWVKANPDRFVCTTVQDYLDRFPPAANDVIHVEPGSWAGADNGDPEFLKWNGNPDPKTGYSPDRNSWGVMTACRNIVATARDQKVPSAALKAAERMLMVAQTSCYEYWDGTEMWDSHPTRACNQAEEAVVSLLSTKENDVTPPAIYIPQREPYNPGGQEWGTKPESSDFTIWTYAYDFGGIGSVVLNLRTHPGMTAADTSCDVLAGGEWKALPMESRAIPAQTNPKPLFKAAEYSARVTGLKDALVDYYVTAMDKSGNKTSSPILHVYVGNGATSDSGNGTDDLTWTPLQPSPRDIVTFTSSKHGTLHWGVNGWMLPPSPVWPKDTVIWPDNKAVETQMIKNASGTWSVDVGPFGDASRPIHEIDAIMHFDGNAWGKDASVSINDGAASR
ncbi:MAG: hypothetical protein HQM09_05820 [Candidatus Riflebacteria bacterium]|nr:hypothetical protein [Candidatus Riflebacteria bacterium]